jgi:hypothetical protein
MALNVQFHVFTKTEKWMDAQWDFGYTAIGEKAGDGGNLHIHFYDDDGDDFIYCNIIFKDKSILITHAYGFNFHSFMDHKEYFDATGIHDGIKQEIPKMLNALYPEYTDIQWYKVIDDITDANLPTDVIDLIATKFAKSTIKDDLALDNNSYENAMSLFRWFQDKDYFVGVNVI